MGNNFRKNVLSFSKLFGDTVDVEVLSLR